MNKVYLPLSTFKKNLTYNNDILIPSIEELELFFKDNETMSNETFSKRILFSQEIKSNNGAEGYYDDMGLVYNVLYNRLNISDKTKMQRIKNLFRGYTYIFKGNEINKDNLKKLYTILSRELLDADDIANMGKYYRNNPVYIYYSSNMDDEPDIGMDASKLDYYMDELFNYINSDNNFDTLTQYFLKSQIVHFQFVNIHPYYDINGRTSRTVSMWYLLNNEVYPYIIFNRAISLNKEKYYKIVKESRDFNNVTGFLKYMLDNVKVELEKEYIMEMIKSCSGRLNALNYQTLYYILSMNGMMTAKDFMSFYNRYNDKKSPTEIMDTMLTPLIDKRIILPTRETTSYFNSTDRNFVFELNKHKYECDSDKIKKLKIGSK